MQLPVSLCGEAEPGAARPLGHCWSEPGGPVASRRAGGGAAAGLPAGGEEAVMAAGRPGLRVCPQGCCAPCRLRAAWCR